MLEKPNSTLVVFSAIVYGARDEPHVWATQETPLGAFWNVHGAKLIVEVVGERCVVVADTVTVPPKLFPKTVEETFSVGSL